jgi:hypothetical protein
MRGLLRLVGVLWLVFGGVILFIRAQPAPVEPYTALFYPEPGCVAPCFLGIRLNSTPAEEAVSRLENHPWASNVQFNTQQGYIRWNWSQNSPRYLNSFRENQITIQRDTFNVSTITLRIDAPAGDLWTFLTRHTDPNGQPLDRYIRVDMPPCLLDPMYFWTSPAQRVYYTTRGAHFDTLYQPRRAYRGALRCDD